jgi:hypothetical protein
MTGQTSIFLQQYVATAESSASTKSISTGGIENSSGWCTIASTCLRRPTVGARPTARPAYSFHPVDRGTVFALRLMSEPTLDAEMACPTFCSEPWREIPPVPGQGCVETLINYAAGWA